jgi:hypothetical protein
MTNCVSKQKALDILSNYRNRKQKRLEIINQTIPQFTTSESKDNVISLRNTVQGELQILDDVISELKTDHS